jgi:hypothetical protein
MEGVQPDGALEEIARGGAVRYLVGGSDDGPPLDVRGERDLAAVLDEHMREHDAAARLRLGAALLTAWVQHEVVGPALPAALASAEPEATAAACAALGLARSAGAHLLWLADRALGSSGAGRQWTLWRARLQGRVREAAESEEARRAGAEEELALWATLAPEYAAERALALGGQERWSDALRVVGEAKAALGLRASLTGRMGRRTKYQTFECAQLVLQVELEDREEEEEDATAKEQPAEVALEPDSILLEPAAAEVALSGAQQVRRGR